MPDINWEPLAYIVAGIIGFFLKDTFTKFQRTSELRFDIDAIKVRLTALEMSHKENLDMSKVVTRLEEQVKRLAEDIKYLLTLLRKQNEDDKTHSA